MLDRPAAIGYAGLVFMVTTLSLWAAAVPLTEATIVSGTVSVSGQRRAVSHVDGGKVDKLLVSEGDLVEPSQILLTLNAEDFEAQLDISVSRRFALKATIDRLTAERDDRSDWTFHPTLLQLATTNPSLEQILKGEERNFDTRRQAYAAKEALLEQPAKEAVEQKRRLSNQIRSIDRQIAIVNEQIASAKELHQKGYATRSKVLTLERDLEQLITNRLDHEATLAEFDGIIADAERQQLLHSAEFKDSIESSVLLAERELAELDEQIRSLERKIENHVVRSSIHGVVVDLRGLSTDDVVTPATPIVDILPTNSKLIVEAHLPPSEIEGVVEGLDVEVRFPALGPAAISEVKGHLSFVSADLVKDTKATQPFYRIHVSIENLPAEGHEMEIIPGMPADILIKKRARTFFQYILAPIGNHATKAFAV
jgi:HlyD family type I secretion membrane fusion protein